MRGSYSTASLCLQGSLSSPESVLLISIYSDCQTQHSFSLDPLRVIWFLYDLYVPVIE